MEKRGDNLFRVVALKDFGNVKKGDIGGFIEKEENLSQEGLCWVYDNALICEGARVSDNARVLRLVLREAQEYQETQQFPERLMFLEIRLLKNAP